MCGHAIDDQVDPADDDIGVYPMGQKGPFKMARVAKKAKRKAGGGVKTTPARQSFGAGRMNRRKAAQKAKATKVRQSPHVNGTAPAALDLATLKAGTKLIGQYKGDKVTAVIVEASGGKVEGRGAGAVAVRYGGQSYATLSGAAKAVTGSAVNGRKFWTAAA